ncbi:MAG: T9SS type A sorting domain-containing protein [Bacteroidales bacterium]|nr:T9SS type A sorting domain-containing protein [Bacteroidales bacterium]
MKPTLIIILFLFLGSTYSQPVVNDTVSDFTVVDVHGETHNLFSYLDSKKFVCIDFFGITCQQCIDLVPVFNNVFSSYGCNEGNLVFLAINYLNNDGEVLAFEQEYSGIYPSISGLNGGGKTVYEDWQIHYYPQFILIKPDKTVAANIFPINRTNIDSVYFESNIPLDSCGSQGFNEFKPFNEEFRIFPVPTKDILIIEMNQFPGLQAELQIIDVSGKLILTEKLLSNLTKVDISMLRKGVYVAELITSKSIFQQKILIE